eukprot:6208940-Pleurochrysis_carterae.AAC.4
MLSGSATAVSSVDAVVMATESATSALTSEHHHPEKPPPGDVATISNVTAVDAGCGKSSSASSASSGSRMNWQAMPISRPRTTKKRRRIAAGSQPPVTPATSAKSKLAETAAAPISAQSCCLRRINWRPAERHETRRRVRCWTPCHTALLSTRLWRSLLSKGSVQCDSSLDHWRGEIACGGRGSSRTCCCL